MEVMSDAIATHVFTLIVLIGLVSLNIYRLFAQQDFIKLVKSYKVLTPFFHVINAAAAYTGMIVSAFTHDLSITVVFMIATTIFVMVSEIKRYKKMRVIKLAETQKQDEFRQYAKKIAMLQLSMLMLTFIIAKIF